MVAALAANAVRATPPTAATLTPVRNSRREKPLSVRAKRLAEQQPQEQAVVWGFIAGVGFDSMTVAEVLLSCRGRCARRMTFSQGELKWVLERIADQACVRANCCGDAGLWDFGLGARFAGISGHPGWVRRECDRLGFLLVLRFAHENDLFDGGRACDEPASFFGRDARRRRGGCAVASPGSGCG